MAVTSVCVDIETFNLNADFGIVLCGVVKEQGQEPRVFRHDELCRAWPRRRRDDSAVVRAVAAEMVRHPIWIAHNGRKFDLPYLNTRLLRHGFAPLPPPKVLIDPVELARNKMRMSYNSLEQIANLLGVNSKTEVSPDRWCAAAFDGCREAMDYIAAHCVEDVLTLEKVVDRLKELSTGFNSYGSGR